MPKLKEKTKIIELEYPIKTRLFSEIYFKVSEGLLEHAVVTFWIPFLVFLPVQRRGYYILRIFSFVESGSSSKNIIHNKKEGTLFRLYRPTKPPQSIKSLKYFKNRKHRPRVQRDLENNFEKQIISQQLIKTMTNI